MAARKIGMLCGVTVMLSVSGGCVAEEPGDDEAVALREAQSNGMRLNGMRLNGMRLNGMRLNGMRLNGDAGSTDYIETLGIDLHGSGSVATSYIVGSQLMIDKTGGGVVSGSGLDKTTIDFEVQEGAKKGKTAKFKGFAVLPGTDIAVYSLDLKDKGWQSLCEGGTDVIMLAAIWDPETGDRIADAPSDVLTFACRGAALAKCVEFGYRPWASVGGVSLRDHHQACTRMVRADYCGDGTPHTFDGTPIHVLDPLGIQTEDPQVDYVVEAEWGPDGATCLNVGNTRHPELPIGCELPACGSAFASGGLIQSGTVLSM